MDVVDRAAETTAAVTWLVQQIATNVAFVKGLLKNDSAAFGRAVEEVQAMLSEYHKAAKVGGRGRARAASASASGDGDGDGDGDADADADADDSDDDEGDEDVKDDHNSDSVAGSEASEASESNASNESDSDESVYKTAPDRASVVSTPFIAPPARVSQSPRVGVADARSGGSSTVASGEKWRSIPTLPVWEGQAVIDDEDSYAFNDPDS